MYRKIDNLGRIVIPKEIRKHLDIKSNDIMYIKIDKNQIIMEKTFELDLEVLLSYKKVIDKKIKELKKEHSCD